MKIPLSNPKPDWQWFRDCIRGATVAQRPPVVELFIDPEVLNQVNMKIHNRPLVDGPYGDPSREQYLLDWIECHRRLGFDYVRVGGGILFPSNKIYSDDTAGLSRGKRKWANESGGPIQSWEDFENYPWPDSSRLELSDYEFISRNLPEGMGMLVCPTSGYLEVPLDNLIGYQSLCYMLHDNPGLVEAVYQKVGSLIYDSFRQLIEFPNVFGIFIGDDMGYRSGTLIAPDVIRNLVFGWHKKTAELAHSRDMIYLLHCCGQIDVLMDSLIDDVRIDGRHSFEDGSNGILDFRAKFGTRTAALGGADVHMLCTLRGQELRRYIRTIIDTCLPQGRFAVGTGNSVCNYIPLENYFILLEEAFRV